MKKISYNEEELNSISEKLKAIGHPLRIAIIELLEKNKRLTVTDIQKNINIEQATTSNHLKILRDQQILTAERDGKKKYYLLKHKKLAEIVSNFKHCT